MKHPILRIVLPSILSNITVPLLGLVDTAIVGHLGGAAYIGAIALGGMLFNMVYWLFGFLRMGTGGLTAQAYGAGKQMEAFRTLCRALTVGAVIGLLFIAASPLLLAFLFSCVPATPQVADLTCRYGGHLGGWCSGGDALYAFSGWFLGMQNARYPLYVSVLQNVVNIVVSLWLVVGCGWQVDGIATGTLVAQYSGLLTAIVLWRRRYRSLWCRSALRCLWQRGAVSRFFRVHRDIFLRTLCLVAVTTWFTSAGTALGEDILAANALLMQLFVVFSYFMDGWAYAGEALGGRYVGAADRAAYLRLGRHLMGWGGALALLFTLVYVLAGATLVGWLHLRRRRAGGGMSLSPLCRRRPFGRRCRLYLRRTVYRRHGHAADVSVDGCCRRRLFCAVGRPSADQCESVDGLPGLSPLPWRLAGGAV